MTTSDRPDSIEQPYEPPRVESVLTADELAREIQYAGGQVLTDQ